MPDHYSQVQVQSRSQWRGWLTAHHDSSSGVWVVSVKSGCPGRVRYADIIEEALCFGWSDTIKHRVDRDRRRFLLKPWQRGTAWSELTKQRVVRLVEQRLMQPVGLAVVAEARADGSWTALDCVEDLIRAR